MKKNEFVRQLAEYCEFEDTGFTPETRFKSIEDYDSLAILGMIAFTDEKFHMKFTAQQLLNLTDFNSLMTLIGEEKFEDD